MNTVLAVGATIAAFGLTLYAFNTLNSTWLGLAMLAVSMAMLLMITLTFMDDLDSFRRGGEE